jgi:hypothetical protein
VQSTEYTSSFVLPKRLPLFDGMQNYTLLAMHILFIGCLPLKKSIVNELIINALSSIVSKTHLPFWDNCCLQLQYRSVNFAEIEKLFSRLTTAHR